MKVKIPISTKELLLYIVIALATTILVSPRYFSQAIRIPPDSVFVGMTTYFEDFYYYLDQFYQGREGNWLTENRFSIEKFPPTPVYFIHLLMGRIGGWIGLESFQSYNLFGILFKFLFILVSYVPIVFFFPRSVFQRVGTYLVLLYSTSLPNLAIENGQIIFKRAVDVFRTENRILARFGTAPSGMFVNFIFIALLVCFNWFFSRYRTLKTTGASEKDIAKLAKQALWFLVPFMLMTLVDASKSAILILAYVLIVYIRRPPGSFVQFIKPLFWYLALYLGVFALFAGYITMVVNADLVYRQANHWDIVQYLNQIKAIGFIQFIKGFGLLLPLFFLGYVVLIRKPIKSIYELSALVVSAFGLLGYIVPLVLEIPVPGFRFLFPALYVFIAPIAFYGLQYLASKIRISHAIQVLLAGYLVINWITFFRGWSEEIKPLKEPDFHFTYIPRQMFEGLVYLRTAEPREGNVLASPYTSIDLMIPGIAGRYTYSGHFLTTYNSKEKDRLAKKFFFEWTDQPETHEFLKKNNIRFLVVSQYSELLEAIKTYYPFLKTVFENPALTIFRYDPT